MKRIPWNKGLTKSSDSRVLKNAQTVSIKNIIGKRFGKLVVLKEVPSDKHRRFQCICDCGQITEKLSYCLLRGHTKSCGCNLRRHGEYHPNWKGSGDISSKFLQGIIARAKKKDKTFSLSAEFLWDLFIKQNKSCALSGLVIEFGTNASVDRIDSSGGYTQDNVQWVHKDINIMKNAFEQKYFLSLCKTINDFNK